MGWWQDFKESYDYPRKVKEHQAYCKRMQAELAEIQHTPGKSPSERDLMGLSFRAEAAPTFIEAPKPPEKPSFWGRLFGRMKTGATELPPKEQEAYDRTQREFSKSPAETANREMRCRSIEAQVATNTAMAERVAPMSKGDQARSLAYRSAVPNETFRYSNVGIYANNCERNTQELALAMMEIAPANATPEQIEETKAHNRETVALMDEYAEMVTAKSTPETAARVNQARYTQVTQQVADKLKPIVAEGKALSDQLMVANGGHPAGYGPDDSLDWMTPTVADGIRKHYLASKAIRELVTSTDQGSAGALLFDSVESANEYQDTANHLATYHVGVRCKAASEMSGASNEQMNCLAVTGPNEARSERPTLHMQSISDPRLPFGGDTVVQHDFQEELREAERIHATPATMNERERRAYNQNVANIPVASGAKDAPAQRPVTPAPKVESIDMNALTTDAGKSESKKRVAPPVDKKPPENVRVAGPKL